MKEIIRIVSILLAGILVAGCSYTNTLPVKGQIYMGPKLDREETAVIKGGGHFIIYFLGIMAVGYDTKATIHKVDGQIVEITKDVPVGNPEGYLFPDRGPKQVVVYEADEVEVLPGPHELEITIIVDMGSNYLGQSGGKARITRHLIFNFDAEAGHTYRVKLHPKTTLMTMKNITISIIDERTKEVIASNEVGIMMDK